MVDRIGSILTPVLLIMLFIIIVKGVSSPLGIPVTGTILTPFKNGFVEGYQTMDTLASIVFAGVILKSIRGDKDLSPKQEFLFGSSKYHCMFRSIHCLWRTFFHRSISKRYGK